MQPADLIPPDRGIMGRQADSRGITLIEALITLAILAIITAIAAPSFTSLLGSSKAKAAAADLQSMLELGRSEAVRRGKTVTLCPSTSGTGCTGGTEWKNGWIVFSDAGTAGTVDGTDEVLRSQPALASSLTFTGPTVVSFSAVGFSALRSFTVTDAGQASSTRYVCVSAGGASSVKTTACNP